MEKPCSYCGKPVGPHGAKGYCPTCYTRWKRNGTAEKRAPKTCSYCGESVGRKGAKGYCGKHYARFARHGDPSVSLINREHGPACSECDESPVAQGYCTMHYQRWKKWGDPNFVVPKAEPDCLHCGEPVGRHGAKGYCGRCYQRWHRHGDASIVLLRGGGSVGPQDGSPRSGAQHHVRRPGRRLYSLDEDFFTEISTPEQAYWLGFIAADGCVLEDTAGRPACLRVDLAQCDENHLRILCAHLGSNRPVLYSDGCACVSFGSRRLASALCNLGVTPRKSLIVEPWDGPADLMPHYWRGLFDGDGTIFISRGSWCVGICGSYACVAAFGSWARGITGGRSQPRPVRKDSECWQWTSQGSEKSQLLAASLYGDAPVALARKLLLARELCAIDFAARRIQRNAQRAATMQDAWSTGRHPRANKA